MGIGEVAPSHAVRHRLAGLLGRRRNLLLAVASSSLVGGFAEALFLVLMTRTGFAAADGERLVELWGGRSASRTVVLAAALGLVLLRVACAVYAGAVSSRMNAETVADVRSRLADAYLGAQWPVQQASGVGQLQELLTTFTVQLTGLLNSVAAVSVAAFNLAALLLLSVVVDPVATAGVALVVAVLGSVLRPVRSAVRRRARAAAGVGSQFAGSLSEVTDLGMEIHVFHVQDAAAQRVKALVERAASANRRLDFMRSLVPSVYVGLAYLAVVMALAVVSWSDATNLVSIGAVMMIMLRSMSYGQNLQNSLTQISATAPYLDQLQDKLAEFQHGARTDYGVDVPEVSVVGFNHVGFEYVANTRVLHDMSFSIGPKEVVGIVGPSGGGKSTLVQLLLGLREPTEGSVEFDGTDIRRFDRSQFARRVTFVPQEAHLFNGTIEENIRFFRPGIADTELEAAARAANLWADIEGFQEGLARNVGDRGGHLSGGQRQRLCIARALVERPDVLILDEPTSALDVRSEQLIRDTLEHLSETMTIVIIAHRLSTLDICDRIMVIQGGRLVAFDTPKALEASNDFFREALDISGMR